MSKASERKRMIEQLAGYSLVGVPRVAEALGCSPDTVVQMMDDGRLPFVTVGKRRKMDPIKVGVYMLADQEGLTIDEYFAKYGAGVAASNARRLFNTIGVYGGAA